MSIPIETPFSEAAQSWLDSRDMKSARVRYLKPRTLKTYRLELEALALFFGDTRLCDITNESLAKYQRRRSEGLSPFRHARSADHINDELRKLEKILTRAGLWTNLQDSYETLEVPHSEPRRVMSKREEAHLFEVASSRAEFSFIYAYCMLSVGTSASGCELRGLRLLDIDLVGRTLQINAGSAKNAARVRTS